MDSKSAVDMSGNVSVAAGAGCAMASAGADVGAGMGSMVVVQAGMIAGSVASVCVAGSEVLVLTKVQHISVEVVDVNIGAVWL